MTSELRPLNFGEILDRTFQLYRGHFLMFSGISTLAAAVDLVWKLCQTGILRFLGHHVSISRLAIVNLGFSLVNMAVYMIASAVVMAAINRAVSAIYLGHTTGIAQALTEVKDRWFRYVRLYVVAFLIAWSPAIVAFIAILTVMTTLAKNAAGAATALYAGVLGLSMLLVVPFGLWMMLRYSLANAACVSEDLKIRESLKRSVFLSEGSRGKIFVLLFLVSIIITLLAVGAETPMMVAVFKHPGHLSLFMTIYSLLVGFVITSLTTPIYGIGLTLFYYDGRIRKEGFDIEWMMQRTTEIETPHATPLDPPAEPSLG